MLAVSTSSAGGQSPTAPYGAGVALRPVPKFGTQADTPADRDDRQRQGWNLKWRQSNQLITGAVRSAPDGLRRALNEPQLSKVSRVNWQAPIGEMLIPPPSARLQQQQQRSQAETTPDFFDNPFGDDASPVKPAPASQPAAEPAPYGQGERIIQPPPAAPALPNELRRTEDLRRNMFEQATEPLPVTPGQIESLPEPLQPSTRPTPQELRQSDQSLELPEPKAEPSLGDVLRQERTDSPTADSNESDLSAPQRQDPEPEDPFRFSDREQSGNEASDNPPSRLRNFDQTDDIYNNLNQDELEKPGKLACNDFRQRIDEQTIDKVSLDISPPYRPDEIDLEKYQELKAEFDENQAIHDWRAIDGTLIARGRLRDLAYEKAIIVTDQGSLEELQMSRLSEADLAFIAENWGLPSECLLDQTTATPRNWVMTTMTWKASNLCHTPLYFEDVNLERYGHTHGPVLEPFVQSAHFFGNILVLPYKMGVHSPHECQYALGYYRPGNCAPWIKQPVPISAKGALIQAVTMTGLFWLIP